MIEDLGSEEGLEEFKVGSKIALIDADTIAYASACACEYAEELLPKNMHSDEEWAKLISHTGYDAEGGCVWHADVEQGIASAIARISEIQSLTDTKSVELYFTKGRNFRYKVYDLYKANRKSTRYPQGLNEIKDALLAQYEGMVCEEFEADDKVVQLKQAHSSKYVLCAVDKDVINAVAGEHFNYYRSEKYNIPMKWVTIDSEHAFKWPYKQCLMGDSGDNVPGCKGVGKVGADKALAECNTPCEMWKAVVGLFLKKKHTIKDAIRDMRLVHMHQLNTEDEVVLWNPPCDV